VVAYGLAEMVLDLLLVRLKEIGLVEPGGKQRTDSTGHTSVSSGASWASRPGGRVADKDRDYGLGLTEWPLGRRGPRDGADRSPAAHAVRRTSHGP
jgi:hypothetical protein